MTIFSSERKAGRQGKRSCREQVATIGAGCSAPFGISVGVPGAIAAGTGKGTGDALCLNYSYLN